MARNYTRERLRESRRDKEKRSLRNKARRLMKKYLTKKFGAAKAAVMMKGKHVDHKTPLHNGGTNTVSNLRLRNPSENSADKPRGYKHS